MEDAAAPWRVTQLLGPAELKALAWSTLAGLATTLGGLLAIIKRPEAGLLAFLLGTAIGVMATLSVLELIVQNARENGVWEVALCAGAGGLAYVLMEPLLPHFEVPVRGEGGPGGGGASGALSAEAEVLPAAEPAGRVTRRSEALRIAEAKPPSAAESAASAAAVVETARKDNLLRLGFLMAVTMTLHNLPEGFAVAFASLTEGDFGPVMALAVAVHNIPEGLIVAAPIYAATGSRRYALGTAFVSGLSEPVGALLALLFVKPFLTPLRLQLMLAFVGGIMTAVCWVELLPEGRRCKRDAQLARGTLLGGAIMAATLVYV